MNQENNSQEVRGRKNKKRKYPRRGDYSAVIPIKNRKGRPDEEDVTIPTVSKMGDGYNRYGDGITRGRNPKRGHSHGADSSTRSTITNDHHD